MSAEAVEAVIAIVPMKPLRLAKSRLADALTDEQRAALTLGMLRGVIAAAQGAPVSGVWVVGGDDAVRQATEGMGAAWRRDPAGDLNAALADAMRDAFESGGAALYLPADLPFLAADDVRSLLRAAENGARLTFAPARRDGGTNAMLIPRGSRFMPLLGKRSFSRHKASAAAQGIPYAVCDSGGFAIDLDTPADLAACVKAERGFISRVSAAAAASGG